MKKDEFSILASRSFDKELAIVKCPEQLLTSKRFVMMFPADPPGSIKTFPSEDIFWYLESSFPSDFSWKRPWEPLLKPFMSEQKGQVNSCKVDLFLTCDLLRDQGLSIAESDCSLSCALIEVQVPGCCFGLEFNTSQLCFPIPRIWEQGREPRTVKSMLYCQNQVDHSWEMSKKPLQVQPFLRGAVESDSRGSLEFDKPVYRLKVDEGEAAPFLKMPPFLA